MGADKLFYLVELTRGGVLQVPGQADGFCGAAEAKQWVIVGKACVIGGCIIEEVVGCAVQELANALEVLKTEVALLVVQDAEGYCAGEAIVCEKT